MPGKPLPARAPSAAVSEVGQRREQARGRGLTDRRFGERSGQKAPCHVGVDPPPPALGWFWWHPSSTAENP